MKISQDVRDFAKTQGISDEDVPKKGMEVNAAEFVKKGTEIYHKA